MNHWIVRLLTLCSPVLLLLVGCQSQAQSLIPVTGAEAAIPTQVQLARANVLEYVVSSARLANAPSIADWQLDNQKHLEGEYHFRCGDWLMIIWAADVRSGNQRVSINNQVEKAVWWGYVEPNGHVVDTAYAR